LTAAEDSLFLRGVPITELYIEGLRTIDRIRLRLDGLTVLIGDNGSGKSSIIEACELLRRATTPSFLDDFHRIHGGLTSLLRRGATQLVLGVTVQPDPTEIGLAASHADRWPWVRYKLELIQDGAFAKFRESISARRQVASAQKRRLPKSSVDADGFILLGSHDGTGEIVVYDNGHARGAGLYDAGKPMLSNFEDATASEHYYDAGKAVAAYLRRIQVHLPFEVMPAWAGRALDRKSSLRSSTLLTPAEQLDKLGINLASTYHALKNAFGRSHWEKTLEYVQLGLGERVEDIVTWADPGGGNVGLSLKLSGLDKAIPSSQLSDGMLSYLAFVALFRLDRKPASLVAFDEPDLHLHPHLLMRVLDFFENMASGRPVLLATHSDRLLDGLQAPERSVVLCELGADGATRLVRPDAEALAKWLERYRGLGDLRSAGHAASVLTKKEPAP
jgi:predicted ATPase